MALPQHWPLIVWLFLGEAVGYLGLLWLTFGRRASGIGAFRGIVCGAMQFLVAEALILVTGDPATRFVLTCASFSSVGLIAPCVAFLFAERTGWTRWNQPRLRAALLAGGMMLAGLRVFDPWTGWVSHLAREEVRRDFGVYLILYAPSWGYVAILCMCAATATFCIVATARAWPEASPLQRRQLLPMMLACVPPMLSEVLFNLDPARLANVDPTPCVLGLTVACMGWAVLRSGFVVVAPIARAFLFENLNQATVATDEQRNIVDYNPAASRSLNWLGSSATGKPLPEMLANWPALAALCRQERRGLVECPSGDGPSPRHWEAAWHPLKARQGRSCGYLLMLTDVTERKRSERALAEALAARTVEWERATKAAVSAADEEQRRIGRLLHDSLCQDLVGMVRTTEALAASDSDPRGDPRLSGLTERLQRASQRARDVAHLLEGPDLLWASFDEALEALLAQMESQFDLRCDLTISPYFPPLAPTQARSFLNIVREAVVNAVRHGKARQVWVDLTCALNATTAVATISNDGSPPPALPEDGLGMQQMRMRASLLGARLTLECGTGGNGARLRLQLPLPADPASTASSR